MQFVRRFVYSLALLTLLGPALALGQEQKQNNGNTSRQGIFTGSPLFWRTDWVLDAYIAQITRYYNLNKEQEEYTRKLLNQRVKAFLQEHEADVRSLMSEYMEFQISQELPEPRTAQEFANKAGPLARDIRKEIFEGNMRWREILDDQQRAKHDEDLKKMTTFFDNLEQGLDRWKDGRVQPSDVPGRVGPRPANFSHRPEDAWEYWVKNFIKSYKLDEGQQQTALSILRELKDEANRYRESNKERFAALEAEQKAVAARTEKTDADGLAKYREETARIRKQRVDLERPILALFDQLRSRVEAVPTIEQRKTRQAEVDRMRLASRRPTTRPTIATSRPTTNVAAGPTEPSKDQ